MRTLVAGIGSANGTDRLGWSVVDALKQQHALTHGLTSSVQFIAFDKPIEMAGHLAHKNCLLLFDAAQSKLSAPLYQCLSYPSDFSIDRSKHPNLSNHGLSLIAVLDLLNQLQQLPPSVTVFALNANAACSTLTQAICADSAYTQWLAEPDSTLCN